MSWKYFPLGENNLKAREQVLENFIVGAHGHTLTKKLLARFSEASGPMLLIANDLWDIDQCKDFVSGGLYKKPEVSATAEAGASDNAGNPFDGLERLIRSWLLSSPHAVVLCENPFNMRDALVRKPRQDSRLLLFGQELYHVLLSTDISHTAIECTIRESSHHWATAVCSLCGEIPEREIASEAFFDEIVADAVHIFTPAIDGEGYLFWSPTRRDNVNWGAKKKGYA